MRIAILGWGSLLWEGGREFNELHNPWQHDGPCLKIEFSRVSKTRLGALTLVIDAKHGTPTTVAWCMSKREEVGCAIADLGRREGTAVENIGHLCTNEDAVTEDHREAERCILAWARMKRLNAVVWTALKSNFEDTVKIPFSVDAALVYISTLGHAGKMKASEYVWRAPKFVQTPLRAALQGKRCFHRVETAVPRPTDWSMLYGMLKKAWQERGGSAAPEPPVPLILGGAAFSSAREIRQRWYDLINWSNQYGFSDLLLEYLPPAPEVDIAVAIAGVGEEGGGWWPEYGAQYHAPKPKPSREAVIAALRLLGERWNEIAGAELAGMTKPLKFTGRKSRRLLVAANPEGCPPWGSWYLIRRNPRTFTTFRSAVNEAITPLEADDITFVTDRWSS
jgi:hypothetical protein